MISTEFIHKYYPPEHYDGTQKFYDWIRAGINKDFTALNVGAGLTSERKLKSLKGEVRQVYGVDIDEDVLSNKDLDFSIHLKSDLLPFEDNFFDIAWSDYVLEHVKEPELFFKEIYRVLKPNSKFYFRTPNINHYVSIISRLTPHWFHLFIANKFMSNLEELHKSHVTYYRANSKSSLIKYAKSIGFNKIKFILFESEPSYLLFSKPSFYLGLAYERVVNKFKCLESLRANIFGCLTK